MEQSNTLEGNTVLGLGTLGLMGKIHIVEDMTVEQVAAEVRSVFKEPMNKVISHSTTYNQLGVVPVLFLFHQCLLHLAGLLNRLLVWGIRRELSTFWLTMISFLMRK